MANRIVTGEEYFELDGRLGEIKRQLRQPNGYPFEVQDLRTALQNIIEGRFHFTGDGSQFSTWRTVKIGSHVSVEDLKSDITKGGHNISDYSKDILGKPAFTLADQESELELVKVTARELGFSNGATRKDIYNRAIEQGLMICPSEVGPQLKLQYKDQPKGEWLLIAMEPITVSDGDLRVFRVERDDDGESWLSTDYDDPGIVWDADSVWVFARRKNQSSAI